MSFDAAIETGCEDAALYNSLTFFVTSIELSYVPYTANIITPLSLLPSNSGTKLISWNSNEWSLF